MISPMHQISSSWLTVRATKPARTAPYHAGLQAVAEAMASTSSDRRTVWIVHA